MHTLEDKASTDAGYDIFAFRGENSKMEIFINGKKEQILTDSDASANIVSKQDCKRLNITSLKPTKKKLYPHGCKELLKLLNEFDAEASHAGTERCTRLHSILSKEKQSLAASLQNR